MSVGNRAAIWVALLAIAVAACSPVGASSESDEGAPVRALGQVGDHPSSIRSLSAPDDTTIAEADAPATVPVTTTASSTSIPPTTSPPSAESESSRPRGTIVAHATTDEVVAYTEADDDSEAIEAFANPTGQNGPLVFQAIGTEQDGWLEVLLPIRPNGTTGWIKTADVDLTLNPYLIEVEVSAYELRIYRFGELEFSTSVAIGTGDTPTPIGEFYLVELLKPSNPNGAYGSYAYGLSGYSETLESFNGGEGVIGIHGTNQPTLLGQDVSHGCIRVANPEIEKMVSFLPLGTPVHISS